MIRRIVAKSPSLLSTNKVVAATKTLSTSPLLAERAVRFIPGTASSTPISKIVAKQRVTQEDPEANIEALKVATEATAEVKFRLYPDEETADTMFDGVKYRDLPYVTVKCGPNHTRFWADKADGTQLHYVSPQVIGFMNAKKRTNVAAQAAGLAMGQKLRQMNVRTIRVRINGFNDGRVSGLKGLVQAGMTIVSLSDVTPVHWDWPRRAKKPKRRN